MMVRSSVANKGSQSPWLKKALRDKGRYFGRELLSILLLPPEAISGLRTLDSKRRRLSRQLGLRERASWAEIEEYLRRKLAQTWQKAGVPINGETSWKELGEKFVKFHELERLNSHIFAEDLMLVMFMDMVGAVQEPYGWGRDDGRDGKEIMHNYSDWS